MCVVFTREAKYFRLTLVVLKMMQFGRRYMVLSVIGGMDLEFI